MTNIIMKLAKRLLCSIYHSLGIEEDDSDDDLRIIENLKNKQDSIKSAAAKIIADEYRLERLLNIEKDNLAKSGKADTETIHTLEAEMESVKQDANNAKKQLSQLQNEVKQAIERAKSAQLRSKLAEMKTQTQNIALEARFDDDLASIERMEKKASKAEAEAEAVEELKKALEDED